MKLWRILHDISQSRIKIGMDLMLEFRRIIISGNNANWTVPPVAAVHIWRP
jgi:hypothetical protein